VVISSRVHPGETPASHILAGLVDHLLGPDASAAAARRSFVFKIIPFLNPDGVERGHYRADTRGVNLNRTYTAPDSDAHPAPYALRALVQRLHVRGGLFIYLDLHGHANKRGCFFYGNALSGPAHTDNMLYVKLAAMNSVAIDFEGSNFSAKNMCVVRVCLCVCVLRVYRVCVCVSCVCVCVCVCLCVCVVCVCVSSVSCVSCVCVCVCVCVSCVCVSCVCIVCVYRVCVSV
jgi:hypothetical protein